MEKVDVALLTIMWVCLGMALALSLSICAVITCRRKIVKSLKVQHSAAMSNGVA